MSEWKTNRGGEQVPGRGTPVGRPSKRPGAVVATVSSDDTVQEQAPDATERAQELAEELDVDLDTVDGTGEDGRITADDVRDAADESS